jgi:sulfite oxidase
VQAGPSENYFQALDYRILPPETDPDASAPGEGISLSSLPLNCDILSLLMTKRLPLARWPSAGGLWPAMAAASAAFDVSLDDGRTWRQADLQPVISPWAWRLWSLTVDARPGSISVTARAWDETGVTQPESSVHLWNPRGYGNNAWARVEALAR